MYGVKGKKFRRQYNKSLSEFKNCNQKSHAEDYILYPENSSPQLSLDEVALSQGELYTVLTSKEAKGRKGASLPLSKELKAKKLLINFLKSIEIKTESKRDYFGYGRFYETRCQKMLSQCDPGYRPLSRTKTRHRSCSGD